MEAMLGRVGLGRKLPSKLTEAKIQEWLQKAKVAMVQGNGLTSGFPDLPDRPPAPGLPSSFYPGTLLSFL